MAASNPDESGPPNPSWGDDPAERAAAVAIAGAGIAGIIGYFMFDAVGVLLVGMIGAIATIRNQIYDDRVEAPYDDEPRMIAVHARVERQRQRLRVSHGERMAEQLERTDNRRTLQVLTAVFWAEVALGLYLLLA